MGMKLINCPECSKEIKEGINFCPYCRAKLKNPIVYLFKQITKTVDKKMLMCIGLILLLIIIEFIIGQYR